MKSTIEHRMSNIAFNEVYETIKKRIVEEGFLLLHEINTQEIVAKHGITIPALRQLLFFEPKYIAQIMELDPLAINDIPMKIVLQDMEEGTSISFQDPRMSLNDYSLEDSMLKELLERIHSILNF
ncbi:DUF302 domain-containing protein [Flagellimonas nanhaiensis]|uniref:DUF302 domain-containing protein n=1 Tax=Flagellimonas nanhaiensis TaxID=2292706 RepID=A0A371JUQ6_9FLAO|nr:DUF302 domain-containing protein [Allomuricauda nanhaiensis]RDY61516.1 DUF302 domain-containing protein [Allomuricauda nanhaiensis]